MATLAENKLVWDGKYDWPDGGDEWSGPWGGPRMQWYAEIFPRIESVVKGKVLEIACGYGRWTEFLQGVADELTVVDLSEECIGACQKRFDGSNITFYVNDGMSLDMIKSNSIDFIYSYDSLVHADSTVIDSYLSQFSRVLTEDGSAFIHHSNLGEYSGNHVKFDEEDVHWRDPSVSAKLFETCAAEHGLCCIAQELMGWDKTEALIDCYSTVVQQSSRRARKNIVYRNSEHAIQTQHVRKLSKLY